jgi:hypothetical protein
MVMSERTRVHAGIASVSAADVDVLTALEGHLFPRMIADMAPIMGARCGAAVLVQDNALWFRAQLGFTEASTAREGRLWDVAMATDTPLVVEDLLADPRFSDGPRIVGGVEIRFFLSCVFHDQEGRPIGVLCFADPDPVELDQAKLGSLQGAAMFIETQLAAINEFDRAAAIQQALLPRTVPPLDGYQVAGACVAAKSVGGDFFDWYPVEGGMALTLSDVMGKGVGSGILAAAVRATIRTAQHEDDVALAVDRAAEALQEDLSEAESFVTLFHARLRAADGLISYVDAGHGLSVILQADGTGRRLETNDFPLGPIPGATWSSNQVTLEKGGMLISFSDGVLDLYDGSLRAVEEVAKIARRSSSAQEVVDEIARLARRDTAPDDVTVVAISRTR